MKPVLRVKKCHQPSRLAAADDRLTIIDGHNICLALEGQVKLVTGARGRRFTDDPCDRRISAELANHRFCNAGAVWVFHISGANLLCDPGDRHFIGGGLGNRRQAVYGYLICVYAIQKPEPCRDGVIGSGHRGQHVRLVTRQHSHPKIAGIPRTVQIIANIDSIGVKAVLGLHGSLIVGDGRTVGCRAGNVPALTGKDLDIRGLVDACRDNSINVATHRSGEGRRCEVTIRQAEIQMPFRP